MNEEFEDQENEESRVTVSIPMHRVVEQPNRSVVREILLVVGVVVVLGILTWAFMTREDTGAESVPQALIGLWTSSDPNYSDRTLTLKADSITFGTGGANSIRYSIIGVAEQVEDHVTYYVVHFKGEDGAEFRREIILRDDGQTLTFRSQPDIEWTRFRL